jgi:hypothetical protein
MLTYLLGDVIRIFAGDFTAGQIGGKAGSQWMWVAAAGLMLIPILMVVLSLMLPYPAIRWVTVGAAVVLFLFNAVGLPGYPGLYDKLLIVFGLGLNVLTIWLAWGWRSHS